MQQPLNEAAVTVQSKLSPHLRMRVVAVDKKVYMAAKSVVLSTEDRQVVVLLLSSTRCSQQLALLALFTATGKRIWPIISLIRTFTYPA